jgi:hypothetical protein
MKTISLKSKTGSDGILKLKVPLEERNTDVEVVIVIQPGKQNDRQWPDGFFKQTYGCLKEMPIEMLDQGQIPDRPHLT